MGALAACDVASPPTPRPIPTPVRKACRADGGARDADAGGRRGHPDPAGGRGFRSRRAAAGTNPSQGWRPIGVGQGNYMVDSIGASHVSGESLLFARAEDVGARAYLDTSVPRAGQYLCWRGTSTHPRSCTPGSRSAWSSPRAPPPGGAGSAGATRGWFFNLEDAPGTSSRTGSRGWWWRGGMLDLAAASARFVLEVLGDPSRGEPLPGLAAVDQRPGGHVQDAGERARTDPGRDRGGGGRAGVHADHEPGRQRRELPRGGEVHGQPGAVDVPGFVIDKRGWCGGRKPARLSRERSPWVDVSCRHDPRRAPCAQPGQQQPEPRVTLLVELASAAGDGPAASDRVPGRGRRRLLTTCRRIPQRRRRRSRPARRHWPDRRGARVDPASAAEGAGLDAGLRGPRGRGRAEPDEQDQNLPAVSAAVHAAGSERVQSAGGGGLPGRGPGAQGRGSDRRQVPACWATIAGTPPRRTSRRRRSWTRSRAAVSQGFSYGDEVSLSAWSPKDGRDDGVGAMLQAKGFQPEDVMPADDAASATRRPLDQRWRRIRSRRRRGGRPQDAAPLRGELAVHRGATLDRLAAASGKLRETFGNEIVYGRTSRRTRSSGRAGPLRPGVQARRDQRASHSDYWWQVGELGRRCRGICWTSFGRAARPARGDPGVRDAQPGTTDADFSRSVVTAISHGRRRWTTSR